MIKSLNLLFNDNKKIKKNQARNIKLISIICYLNKIEKDYRQKDILNLMNFFLKKEGEKEIKLKTLQKDLLNLKNKGYIKTYIKRLGKYRGSVTRYLPLKNASSLLSKNFKQENFEIANKIKEETKTNNKIRIINKKNSNKNSSVNNKIRIINKKNKEEEEKNRKELIKAIIEGKMEGIMPKGFLEKNREILTKEYYIIKESEKTTNKSTYV